MHFKAPYTPQAELGRELDEILRRQRGITKELDEKAALLREAQENLRREMEAMQARMRPPRRPTVQLRTRAEYDLLWAGLLSLAPTAASVVFTYETFPWPVARSNPAKTDIIADAIASFVLAGVELNKWKYVVKQELKRWHPDKFALRLAFVADEDRERVRKGSEKVVRCLNELLQSL